jgi:agmatinase
MLQVPYDATTTYIHGTKFGPSAIIDASRYMERFDDELNQETFKMGIHTMAPLSVESDPPDTMVDKVYAAMADILKANKFPVMIGGEHSVTIGAVRAFKEAYPNISVLHLDAHYDLRDEFNGSRLNHGCVMRRVAEICPIVQVGTRSLSKEEKDFLSAPQALQAQSQAIVTPANGRIKTFSAYDILDMPMWKDNASNSLTENVYISVDLDVFDPSVAPAVGTPEPGGIGWYETLDFLKEVAKDKKVVGFDVVELCPIKGQVATDFLAAKLIYRLLGYVLGGKR